MIFALIIPVIFLFVFLIGIGGMCAAVLRRRRERLNGMHGGVPGRQVQPPDDAASR